MEVVGRKLVYELGMSNAMKQAQARGEGYCLKARPNVMLETTES
jgi:hypothetical protein